MKTAHLGSTQIHSNTDSSIGFFLLPNIAGLEQPEIRLPSFNRPNVDGAVVPNQLYGGRLITLLGRVHGDDVSTYRSRRRTLQQAVAIQKDSNDEVIPITFKFTTMDDLDLQVEVYNKSFSFPDKFMLFGDYKLDLFAPSLYLLSQVAKSTVIYPFDAGGMAIPMGIPMAFNANAAAVSPLANDGNVDAYPTIQINGPITDPTLVNETKDQTMNFDYTLSSGQYIVIDTQRRTVVYYSSLGASPVNIRDALTGDFITLAPGSNIVKLTLGSFSDEGNVQFTWRDSYSGI